jgi:hypothetical protein
LTLTSDEVLRSNKEKMMIKLSYRIETAKDGNPTLIVQLNGRDTALHSKINPLKEGNIAGYVLEPERFDFLVVLGCGLGYNFIKLKEYTSQFRQVVVIDILYGIEKEIEKNPYTSFLSDGGNIRFLSGMEDTELDEALSEIIDFHELKGIQVIEHAQSQRIFTGYYEDVKNIIKKIIDKKAGDKATIRAFGNLFFRNALNNINSFKHCSPVSALAGKFRGRRAVIVSSAPSLEDNIEKLKFYEKDIYIIAVDSALPVLHCFDIKPDFVISIDPQARIGEHFLEHQISEALHVFSIVSPPELVKKYSGYISLNSHPVSQIIEDMYPSVNGSIDSSTGSVAGDAFMFALGAGFESIAITGFDFSFSENIIYSRETAYQKRYALYFNSRLRTAETFNAAYIFKSSGSLVVDGMYTRRAFIGYKNSLDSLIKEKNFKNIFMINRRGLPLMNVQPADFDSFMNIPGIQNENKNENKHDYLREISKERTSFHLSIRKIKERLLDERVLDEIIKESLGSEALSLKREKIISMIKNIS